MNNELIERIDSHIQSTVILGLRTKELLEQCKAALTQQHPMNKAVLECLGCGWKGTWPEYQAMIENGAIACCPGRNLQPITQQQKIAQRLESRLAQYLRGECVCPPMDNEAPRTEHYPGCPEVYKQRIAELDAQQQGAEPVAYQSRMRPDWDHRHAWTPWESCSKGTYEDFKRVPVNAGWIYEARALYLHPPKPAAQPQVPETDRNYPPFLQRLLAEQRDLRERQGKLEAFIGTTPFEVLDGADRGLLTRQCNQQHSLLHTLNQRISSAIAKHASAAKEES